MRKYIALILTLIFGAGFPVDGTAAPVENLDLGGFLQADKRLNISDGAANGDTYGKLRLEAKYDPLPDLFTLISFEARYYDFPVLEDLPSVGKIESNYPGDLLLWEAYVELNQFIWNDLDLKIGQQRIAWGAADKFNPTDNLNPNDLTDFFDFDAKLPSPAVKANYYIKDYTLTAVWLPIFEPAIFPRGGTASFLGQIPDDVELPEKTLENGMFALKLAGTAFNLDYTLSYFKGFDDLPVAFQKSGLLKFGFPEMQVLGFDFAGEFRSVGFWGEAALFFPQEIKSGPVVILSDEEYLKYTLGADYSFKNGIYLEAQFVRGFFTERGRGKLNNFLIGKIERKFLNDELSLSLGGSLETSDMENLKDSQGGGLVPEISYRPIDNLELTLGVYLFWGDRETLYGRWKDQDQINFKVRLSF